MTGTLYLIPNTLGNDNTRTTITDYVAEIAISLKLFIVEDIRTARRYLKKLDRHIEIDTLKFYVLNEHTSPAEIPSMLTELLRGESAGIISEAGIPGVADPGASVVKLAHEKGIKVVPLSGPSSLMLALMSSGLNGQQFRFVGYLPVKKGERIRKIRELEAAVINNNETQVFIETPYRNSGLFDDIISHCQANTLLSVAIDLTMESEEIRTLPIAHWKRKKPELHKRPAVFLLGNP